MSLSREEILNIAKLSRLEFSEENIQKFQNELNSILEYINVLEEINTDDVEPLVQVNESGMNLREDIIRKSLTSEEAMRNAPQSQDGALIVPKMVEEN